MKKKAVELKTESVEGRLKPNKIKQEDDWSVKTEESCIQTEREDGLDNWSLVIFRTHKTGLQNSKLPKICFTER